MYISPNRNLLEELEFTLARECCKSWDDVVLVVDFEGNSPKDWNEKPKSKQPLETLKYGFADGSWIEMRPQIEELCHGEEVEYWTFEWIKPPQLKTVMII